MARPPSAKSLLRNMKKQKFESKTPIASDMFLPNNSGDHVKSIKRQAPVNHYDLVNKEYVDAQIHANINLFLTENSSDIATYFDADTSPVTATEENTLTAIPGSSAGTLMASYASILNDSIIDDIVELEVGVYSVHIHADASKNGVLTMYTEIYHRTSGGTETLLLTTEDSDLLTTTKSSAEFHGVLTTEKEFVSGDRIVVKLYGKNNSSASRNLTIYVEGDTSSRAELPAVGPTPPTTPTLTSYDTGWINRSDWTNVEMGSDDTKNADSDVTHNLDAPLSDLLVKVLISSDGTDNNSEESVILDEKHPTDAEQNRGSHIFQIDSNTIRVQTGSSGLGRMDEGGAILALASLDWYYKIKVYKIA